MTGLSLYDSVADATAGGVIRRYSTSFGLASRLLGGEVRQHVENVYALVRVADEIVDGPATEAGLGADAAGRLLDGFEAETERALVEGFSANLVVHAFARTARATGFGAELTAPFFASMRADLSAREHDQASFDAYVYGSAEVVGLMCLKAFLHGHPFPPSTVAELEEGARRLGAAFQKVNFLRDLADDCDRLGRSYFPGVDPDRFTDEQKNAIVTDIDADLAAARRALRHLPRRARRATGAALGLFSALNRRLAAAPAERIRRERLSVPRRAKAAIVLRAIAGKDPR